MPADTETVVLNELPKIEQGSVIQVSDATGELKYVSRFFGIDGQVIITRLPAVSQLKKGGMGTDELTYRDNFKRSRKLVMRLISNGRVFAFESRVIDLFLMGGKLLMTTYPKQIQSRLLRKEPRYPCAIPAQLVAGDLTVESILINFSTGGGLLKITEEEALLSMVPVKNENQDCVLKLQLPFDESPSEVKVRVMSVSTAEKQIGLSFTDGREVIQRYITALKLDSISDYF
ncbi:PilZ domain-containing protein [Amphritea sp.]|uniref:PilZ domain-containing protein n=1 Tax=Amphritea sp. TaxID=1872502 RepID=UPI0025BDE190|nr:PilZ domain-containing protein [Amphritea sp.]